MAEDPYAKYKKPKASPPPSTTEDADPYARYKKPKAAAKPTQKDYHWTEVPGAALKNAAKGAETFGANVQEFYAQPDKTLRKVGNLAADVAGGMVNLAGDAYLGLLPGDTRQQVNAAAPATKKATGAGAAVVQHYKDRYGSGQKILNSMAEHPFATAADAATFLPIPGSLPAAAARAVPGSTAARAAVSNAMVGAGKAAAKVLPSAVTDTAKATATVAKGVGKALVPTRLVNAAADSVANRMIPNAARYVAEVKGAKNNLLVRSTEGEGMKALAKPMAPRMASLVKQAGDKLPQQAKVAEGARNADILGQIRGLSASPDTPFDQRISDLLHQREVNRQRMYGLSNPVMSQTDARLFEILDLPLNSGEIPRDVLARAERLAQQNERPFGVGQYVPAHTVPDPYGQNLPPIQVPAQYPKFSGEDLDWIKKGFDDLASSKPDSGPGFGPNEIAGIRGARSKFLSWVENEGGNTYYPAAREQYKTDSQRVARERIINKLEETLTSPLTDEFTPKLKAEQFSSLLRRDATDLIGDSNVRKIGGSYVTRLEDVFTPEEMAVIRGVEQELAQDALQKANAAAGGIEYGSALDNAFSDAMHLNPEKWYTRLLAGHQNRSIREELAPVLMDDVARAEAVQNAMMWDQGLKKNGRRYGLGVKTLNFINPYRYANQYPGVFNVLGASNQDEPNNALAR